MVVNGKKIGRGVVQIRKPVVAKTIAEMTIAERIAKFARPVRPTVETADPATRSVRAAAIAAGHIKPLAVAS